MAGRAAISIKTKGGEISTVAAIMQQQNNILYQLHTMKKQPKTDKLPTFDGWIIDTGKGCFIKGEDTVPFDSVEGALLFITVLKENQPLFEELLPQLGVNVIRAIEAAAVLYGALNEETEITEEGDEQ